MKENDSQKKGSNITYDNNRVYKFKDIAAFIKI